MKDKRTGRCFFYINTHLDHIGVQARINSLQLIVDTIARLNKDNSPLILTGDFNVMSADLCLNNVRKQMEDAQQTAIKTDICTMYQAYSAVDDEPVDYVFYKGFTSCSLFEVISKRCAVMKYISDCYSVKAVPNY